MSLENPGNPFVGMRKDIQVYQKQKKSETIPLFGTQKIEKKNQSNIHELKKAAYLVLGCNGEIVGNDPRLSEVSNFNKGVVDTLFELPEFLVKITSDPSLIGKILSKIREISLTQQMSEMLTKYDTPYDAGKSSTNTILTLLGIGGIIKGGMSIVGRASGRVVRKAVDDIAKSPTIMIGDTLVISGKTGETLKTLREANKVAEIVTNPALKSTLSLGLDKLFDSMLELAKQIPALGAVLVESQNVIKQMKKFVDKFPDMKDAGVVLLGIQSIEKNLNAIIDRSSAQYSVTDDSTERRKITLNTTTMIQETLKEQISSIPQSILKLIFK